MYIDVNGKTGYRQMVGTSGKTYGNLKLLSPTELADAKLDGIADYIAPVPAAPTLDQLKNNRKNYIRGEYNHVVNDEINFLGTDWNGGHESAMNLDSAVRLAEQKSLANVDLWDYYNVKHTMTVADAKTVVEAVADAFLVLYEQKQGFMVDIDNATNESEVNAVVWPEPAEA